MIIKTPITSIPKNQSTGVPENPDVRALEGTLSDRYTRPALSQDSVTGQMAGGVVGGSIASITAGVSFYSMKKKWASLKGKSGSVNIGNLITNVSTVMWDLMRYYFANNSPTKPAVVIASIPLGTVTEVSHAMSRRDLKFRAVGGVFLADQKGGEESLRIVGKAWGPNRFIFLSMLDFLFLYGSAKVVDLFADFIKTPAQFGDATAQFDVSELPKTIDPWQDFNAHALDEGIEESRLTFPVITRQKIYLNMFIETYEYTESVENGIDVVEYVIFLRKLVVPPPMVFSSVIPEDSSDLAVKWYYKPDINDQGYQYFNKMTDLLGSGFSTAMIMYRVVSYWLSGNIDFRYTIASRFGIALQRSIEGDVDTLRCYSDQWSVPEKEYLFGYSTEITSNEGCAKEEAET